MLSELSGNNRVIGLKQLKRLLKNEGAAEKVFVALDADPVLLQPVLDACREQGIPVEEVPTMRELGAACDINVGAAVAALARTD